MHLYLQSLHSGFIMRTTDSNLRLVSNADRISFHNCFWCAASLPPRLEGNKTKVQVINDLKTDLSINVSPVCIK